MTTLYLKYRPQKISELDLADVRDLLSKIVNTGNIPHAFLFEGPRGSGKTSAARIIAKVINCTNPSKDNEPCNVCEQCVSITKGTNIDVIELDAASHRGIDDIRLIRESVKLAPAKAKKKVYIIDEAHMLTTEASNALLKTLEEPPDHVVFILATTNPEKLIDTIKSRTVRINFKKATPSEIVKSLSNVLEKEKKKFNKEVLELVSLNVDGSFRDAKKILEELLIKDAINDLDKAQNYLLNKSEFNIEDLFEKLYIKDTKGAVALLNNAENAGVSSKTIYNQIVGKLKNLLFSVAGYKKDESNKFEKQQVIDISDIFITFWNKYQNDVSDYMPFYLSVAEWCGRGGGGNEKVNNIKENVLSRKKTGEEDADSRNRDGDARKISKSDNFEENDNLKSLPDIEPGTIPIDNSNIISDELWKQVLSSVRSKNASTEALLRASKPMNFDGKKLSLGVFYKFHKEKLESLPHKICLEDCLRGAVGGDVKVECFLTSPEVVVKTEKVPDVLNNSPTNGQNQTAYKGSDVILSETEDADLIKLADEVFGS